MLLRQAQWGVYHTLWQYPDLQAYRKDSFTGFVRQPAKTGSVIYAQTSPSYARLKPATAAAGGDDGGGSGGIIAAIAVAVVLLGAGAFVLMRRRSAYERE
jgi:peptide/nickel transport system substrate-binding protein